MTHQIDMAKAIVTALMPNFPGQEWLVFKQKHIALPTQPDPRVTALVEAVKASPVLTPAMGDALAPFLKENQDDQV